MGSLTMFHVGPIWAGRCKKNEKLVKARADPRFLARGFKFTKGV